MKHAAQYLAAALATALVVTLAPAVAQPQVRPGSPRIGVLQLTAAPAAGAADSTEVAFRQGLLEAGYVEGENIIVERRYAGGRPDRLAALADELVRQKVDVILAAGQPPRDAARKATQTIPIVTLSGSDPVREGWAESLARPGGNVTGLTFSLPEFSSKRLELLKEATPSLTRVAVLIDPIELVDARDVVREIGDAARRLGMQMQVIEVHGAKGLEAAFVEARRQQAQALLTIAMWPHRREVAALAISARLPAMGESQEAQAGYLLAYGVDLDDLIRRAAGQVAKVLKGARASDLPIERPAKFHLTVNLKTAKAIGVTVPPGLLLRADEVIE